MNNLVIQCYNLGKGNKMKKGKQNFRFGVIDWFIF